MRMMKVVGQLLFITCSVGMAGFISVFFTPASQAQDISASVQNTGPQIVSGSEKICDNSTTIANSDAAISGCANLSNITPSAGGALSLSFFAKARDNNTNADIPTGPFNGTFYHNTNSDTGNPSCTADNNDCYHLSCSKVVDIAGGGNTDAWLRCDFSLQYYADHSVGAAQWFGYIEVNDQSLIGANNGSAYSTEVAKLVSATFPVVNFGNRQQGTTTSSSNNLTLTHQNNGNVLIDYLVSMNDDDTNSALDCATTGSLPSSDVRFDINDVGYALDSYSLPADPSTVEMNIDVLQRTDDTGPVTDDATGDIQHSYWDVTVPTSGSLGFCFEELNVTVFEGP